MAYSVFSAPAPTCAVRLLRKLVNDLMADQSRLQQALDAAHSAQRALSYSKHKCKELRVKLRGVKAQLGVATRDAHDARACVEKMCLDLSTVEGGEVPLRDQIDAQRLVYQLARPTVKSYRGACQSCRDEVNPARETNALTTDALRECQAAMVEMQRELDSACSESECVVCFGRLWAFMFVSRLLCGYYGVSSMPRFY